VSRRRTPDAGVDRGNDRRPPGGHPIGEEERTMLREDPPRSDQVSGPMLEPSGARPIPDFDGVHDGGRRGARLRAVRSAAAESKKRFVQQGQVRAVPSGDGAGSPYPVKSAFDNAVSVPSLPLVTMINRMVVIQYDDWNGRPRTLVFEP